MKLKVLLMGLVIFSAFKHSFQLPKDSEPVGQPAGTITAEDTAAKNTATGSLGAAQSLAQEIASKASGSGNEKARTVLADLNPSSSNPKEETVLRIRDQILQEKDLDDDIIQGVRESEFLNAFHEAIDKQIIDPSFIQTLASVYSPPVITSYTRDTLMVKSIREDANFTFGDDVFRWKTLEHHKHKDQHLVVGISNVSIVILHEKLGVFSLQQQIPMETVPAAFEVITVWDSANDTAVSGLVVATEMSLVWYTMREKTNFTLTEEWRWPLHKMTTLIKCFRYKETDMILLVGTHPNKERSISATLYEFNFERQQFWLMQKLLLNFPCRTVGVVNVGSEFLVAFPQNNTALIYALEAGKVYRGKFTLIANFTSERINSVGAFHVGRYAYIAIGGKSPQILRYADGSFTTQTIPTEALETVESYLEIPTYTYRDDLILLVQHRIGFSTHEIQRLDILVWNGESFDIRSNIPCYVESELTDNEVSCLLDLHRPNGIIGSAIVQREKHIMMVVPRHRAHSSLFHIEIGLLSAEHPIAQKVQEVHDTVDAFTKILQYQDVVIKQAFDLITQEETVERPTMLLENYTIESLFAEMAYMDPSIRWPNDTIYIGDVPWTYEDSLIDIPALVHEMEYEEAHLLRLEQELSYAVRKQKEGFSLELEQPLHVKGRVEIHGSLVTDDLYVHRLEEEPRATRTARDSEKSVKELRVQYLDVRHLNFKTFNGEPASELVFNTGKKIELNNKIIFEDTVVAGDVVLPNRGTVNGIDLSESVVHFGDEERSWDELKFENLEVMDDLIVHCSINGEKLNPEQLQPSARATDDDSEPDDVLRVDKLVLNGSLHTAKINGVPWEDFIQGIVMKNRPKRIAELRINGSLILEHPNITVSHLNGLAFPGDFLLSNRPEPSIITGHKRFLNTTYMATLDVEGTINGVDLNELITLHDDQHIPGNVTFAELHVMEELEVHGEIHGKGLDQHLFDNPTLLQAKSIEAACHFGELHIDGPVIVRESLDGENLDDLLADVVYDTDGTVEITGQKHFKSVEFHESVTIKSGMVNDIKLEDFVTRSTEQTFNVSDIKGNISIGRLTLDGLFDGLNVTEIDMNSIKLYGDQYTEATLIFKNPAGGARPDIEANELRIEKMLNSKNRSEYLQTHQEEELVLTGNITVKNLTVDKLHLISSSLDGPGKMINDIHLPTFDRQRLSLTRPQEIDTPVFIEKLIVEQTANVTFVNGKNISQLSTIEDKINNLKKELLLGKIKIENLYVEGDIKVNMLNDIKFDELLKNVIWLNRPNFIPGTVHFLEPLYIKGNLTVEGLVNNVNFGEFLADLVLKSDEVMEFYEPKIFKNGFHVEGNLDTERINDIRIDELILKNQSIHITGDVTIHGQLFVNHLLIEDSLNGEPIQKLVDHYQYDAARDVHIIKGDVTLHNASIQSLYVQGGFNEIPNLDLHLASLIRKDQDYNFTEPFVFGGEVIFEQGFTVQTVNGRDISRLQYDIVRINEDDPVELMGGAVFTEPLHIETLTVDGDMIAPSIDGYNPDRWPETSVMINEDVEIFAKIIFEPGTFQTEHIDAKFVNGYSMDEVVTLHTDQVFNTTLYIDEMTISQPLEVGGKVNGLYFPDERENTVMTYGTQHIRIPTVFNSIQVRESLTLPALVNDKPFDPVLIGPKMVIESPVVFQHLVVDNLETRDTISGIDFDRWYNDSLWTAGREHQVIPAKLIADEVRFESSVEGNGMINGVNIQEVVQQIEANKQANEERLEYYKTQFRSFCEKTQDLVGKSQNRLYFFKYFTQRQMISMSYEINSFHFFDHLGYHFLAINSACETHVYQWDSTGKMFVPLLVSYTGAVEHWENVVDSDRAIFLLAKSFEGSFQCNVTGVSVWLFTGVELRLMWHTDEPYSAISSLGEKHDSFFVLAENTVIEYRVNGDLIEQWDLPVSATGYRFVRNIVELGLALSDGRLLVLLSNVNNNEDVVRTKRNTNETVQMGLFATQAMYDRMHRNLTRNHVRTSVIEPVTFTDHIKPNVRAAQPASKQINRTLVNVDNWKSTSVLFRNASINDPAPEASTLVKTTISREMPMGGIFTAENYHFPNNPDGEIISFRVGESSYKQQLVAVSTVVDTIIRGDHDAVKIYHDIQLGQLYQILPCNRPSHLTALELRDETLLVFLESRQTVQIYSYRGAVEGFVRLSSFRLTVPVVQMSAISLPQPARLLLCPKHYLAIATQQHELIFLKAKMHGNCGLTVELDCTTED
ncbi:uncharacterized protein LOC128744042 [Sabethes cyaneus]|uniref:uncharacterized protein LOC128744042 n=1 Tax=Sabethes cyaneus TaxID=53552 RepID=UPI00237D8CBE|nr:uncharacterized protein LOC128744042 [Sabethes cyaneus]